MKFITRLDYLEYRKKCLDKTLEEEKSQYILEISKREKWDEEIDKKHDKIFKVILGQKREMTKFLNQFLNLRETLKEEQLIQCSTEFITKRYKSKYTDILYRLKEIPIYFLVEHQSTVDRKMIERMGTYVGEIMRKEKSNGLYPIVVPIVIYTGSSKWTAKTKFMEKQYQEENYSEYQINLWYNLVAVRDFEFEKLAEKNTLLSAIMIIEKCKTQEELLEQVEKIIENRKQDKDKEIFLEIICNIVYPYLGKKMTDKILGKIEKREEKSMSLLKEMMLDLAIRGEAKGKLETVKKTVENMLNLGESEDKIIKYTGISKEELENIKKMIVN